MHSFYLIQVIIYLIYLPIIKMYLNCMFKKNYLIIKVGYSNHFLPICTLNPICISDIVTDFPFSKLTVAVEGKQPGGGGGGEGTRK